MGAIPQVTRRHTCKEGSALKLSFATNQINALADPSDHWSTQASEVDRRNRKFPVLCGTISTLSTLGFAPIDLLVPSVSS